MAAFLRLLEEKDKSFAMDSVLSALRAGRPEARAFEVKPTEFCRIPKAPFAYWVSDSVRAIFESVGSITTHGISARQGLATADDFRFVRATWETAKNETGDRWIAFAKGGSFSPFFSDLHLVVDWLDNGRYLATFSGSVIRNPEYYFRPGLTWPRRTNGLSFRVLPNGCIFADKGPAIFAEKDDEARLLTTCAVLNSSVFGYLVSLQLARFELAQSFEVGLIQQTPMPTISPDAIERLEHLAHRGWSLMRSKDAASEISHAFLLPSALLGRVQASDAVAIDAGLIRVQAEIDDICFRLFRIDDADRQAILGRSLIEPPKENIGSGTHEIVEIRDNEPAYDRSELLSWCIGVSFGRFNWRLVTSEQKTLPEPDPFDDVPAKSPGMLPDGEEPYLNHSGILVDDSGHSYDVVRLVESVLELVDLPAPLDVRQWLQQKFFKEHLKQYSKSKRKAPIYWPLSTASACYTLWIYYPTLTSQTLYTAINDFLEPKLKEVTDNAHALRCKTDHSAKEEKEFAQLQDLETELKELRETILWIAKDYVPNHDDGVQITAAPLWPLFQHKPWQKVLKDTWKKLEKGDYDWAHLAMNYWPDRVRDKCKTDKSLAIAHGLEDLYTETPGN